ncbi:hypothetical protein KR032_011015 [Drosophila birchii]|nr:hypothetical protein KR032_011015 [Drosophila birchii]
MAAASSRNRCRSKTMPGALLRLPTVLFVLLGLALATLASGNDAISAPKSPKDLQQQQQHPSPNRQQDIEDDGGTRPDKDFDFAAYVNDFNLQEEATIPEDIFDQHDGDIEDEDLGSPQMQYAPSAAAAPSGTNEEEEDDDDEDEDAEHGLMEHGQEQDEEDEDASEAADIILESQRPTSRNFSVYLDAKKYQNNNSNIKKRAKDKKNNISHYNYKLKSNKENQPATKATKATDGGEDREGGEGAPPVGGTTFTSGDEDNANFGRQSFAYKKFKNMHEQQNQQQQQQQQQQQHQKEQQEQEQHQLPKEQRKRGDDGQQQLLEESQLFDSIEILNERKFNKPSGGQEQHQQLMQEQQHGARQVDEAIGDIEDNLDNDEVLSQDNDGDDDDGEDDEADSESLDIKLPNDSDGLPNKKNPVAALTTTTTTVMPTTDTTTTRATPTTTTTTEPTTTVTPSRSTTRTPSPAIGRKQKRHGGNVFGLKRPIPTESRYYGNNYEIGRIREEEQELEQQQDSEEDQDLNLGEMHYYDNGNIKRKLATFDTTRTQDLKENSMGTAAARKLQQPRFVDDDYAEQQPPPEEEQEKVEEENPPDDGKLETDVDSAWQRYHQDTTEPPTSAPESAFERFKALRRSRQRTGHKSHKKRYKDYLKRQPAGTAAATPPPEPTASARHLQKLQRERERERERSFSSHSPPIFAVGLRPQKPFYEGQVNYFDHHQVEQEQEQQQQLEEDLKHRTEMERLIAHDNGNWYRRISPVLRNGVKAAGETQKHHHQHQQHHQHHHNSGHLGNHHHHQQSHHYNHHRSQHGHHQKAISGNLRSRGSNPYQRKPGQTPSGSPSATSSPPPTPPLPPPKPQLGHQITELQHLERYYAKWPHLARVQFQVYDEHYRESHPELYSDYEDDYESAAELEEAQQERGEEANLPPYIKKYNRRNKQLLNLLEGTLPTPTNAPPPPGGSSSSSSTESGIRLDDEYLKEKRRRYHQHQHQRFDLFAQQRSHLNATETSPPPTPTLAGAHHQPAAKERSSSKDAASNHLPEEDVAASDSVEEHPDPAPASAALDFWQREMANKATATDTSTTSTSTPKPALFKLPSYPAIAGSFLGTPRSRSRSAQFVANVAGRGQSSWPRLETTVNATAEKPAGDGENPPGGGGGGGGGGGRGAPSPLNSFVYHRVVDGIGGGIGSGLAGSSRGKQSRLPFVAITDRRLDRSLGERHKDFEQNHYPMP